jgi:hypothetical protein
MKQRLTHKMKIKKDYPPTDFICEKIEFLKRQLSVLPFMLRTEITVEVTYVGYLYIAAVNQFMCNFTIYNLFASSSSYASSYIFLQSYKKIIVFPVFFLVYSFSFATFANIIAYN